MLGIFPLYAAHYVHSTIGISPLEFTTFDFRSSIRAFFDL